MWYLILIVPGLVAAYFLLLRPLLAAIPSLKHFYTEADGFWQTVSALGWHSATIAWSYFIIVMGVVAQWMDPIASTLGDPDLKAQIMGALQHVDPKTMAYFMMFVSLVTIVARLRSITRAN